MLVGILRGEHQEGRRQLARRAVHRDLPFRHRFQKAALGPGRGAVDLVGQHQLGEERARLEHELPAALIEDRDARDVPRQEVARELDAREGQVEGARQGVRQRRLSHPGNVLQQEMARRGEGSERQLDHVLFAAQGAGDVLLQGLRQPACFQGRQRRAASPIFPSWEGLERRGTIRRSHHGRLTRCRRAPLHLEVCESAPPWATRSQV